MIKKIAKLFRKNRGNDEKSILQDEIEKLVLDGAVLVDVRSPQEYEEGHLEGAILIPEYELNKQYKDKLPDKKQLILLYCSTGSRSKRAQKRLEKLGYENVYQVNVKLLWFLKLCVKIMLYNG